MLRSYILLAIGCVISAFVGCATTEPAPSDTTTTTTTETTPPGPEPVAYTGPFQKDLWLCPLMTVSNAPQPIEGLNITRYQPVVDIEGVSLAVAPVEKACLSSGYGLRGERLHKGIDLHNAKAAKVYAAGDGIVREKQYRDDYGNMLVIDHGAGIFSRYAHLESFGETTDVGATVSMGDTIGVMGNTAGYSIPRHLHYEVLTGEWGALAGSFALTPLDPMSYLPDN